MGHGGLYVLVFLSLLVAASEKNKRDVIRCWVRGKEVIMHPHQCPAEFDGTGAKFCCRLCYGANCCLPRRPRVSQARCPRDTRRVWATVGYEEASEGNKTSSKKDWYYAGTLFGIMALGLVIVALQQCCPYCKRCWEHCCQFCCREERIEGREDEQFSSEVPAGSFEMANIDPDLHCHPSTRPEDPPPPYSLVGPQGTRDLPPPPYPGPPVKDPQGASVLPPPYTAEPVVAFRRSRSPAHDDSLVILPGTVAPPEKAVAAGGELGAAVTGSALKAAALDMVAPLQTAVACSTPEEVESEV